MWIGSTVSCRSRCALSMATPSLRRAPATGWCGIRRRWRGFGCNTSSHLDDTLSTSWPGLSRPSTSYLLHASEKRRGCPRHQCVYARLRRAMRGHDESNIQLLSKGRLRAGLLDQLADPGHHRLGCGVDFLDECLQMRAVLGLDIELLFARIGDEILVLHGCVEGVAQHLQPVRRQVRWCHERPPDALSGIEEFERLLLLRTAREVDNVWRAVEVDGRHGAAVEQHVDLLAGDPVRALADDAVEALADAVDLVALHRQEHIAR